MLSPDPNRPKPSDDPRLNDEGLKRRFAAEMLRRPGEPFRVAYELFVDNPNDEYSNMVSTLAARDWAHDPIVIAERQRLQTEIGQAAELPTKETIMLEILDLARTSKTVPDRLKAYAQYSEMQGYTGRNSGAGAGIAMYANKVMLVKDHGTDEQWESGLKAQQQKLIREARESRERATEH